MSKRTGIIVIVGVVAAAAAIVSILALGAKPEKSDKFVGTWKVTEYTYMGTPYDVDQTLTITKVDEESYEVESVFASLPAPPPGNVTLLYTAQVDREAIVYYDYDNGKTTNIFVDGDKLVLQAPSLWLAARRQ